jgi:SAM-dependent methyltransferase
MTVRDRLRSAMLAGVNQRIDELEARLESRIAALETGLHESRDEGWERSRERWRAASPTANLTWDAEIGGDAFIEKAEQHGAVGAGRRVLEVGPGYGRLLGAALERDSGFESWTGIDLSAENVAFLSERFGRDGIRFIEADIEKVRLPDPVDAVISSLTFKHLYPSFEAALVNLAGQLRAGAVVAFDLIEGQRRYFEDDGVTYIRWYARDEIDAIIEGAGLERVAFDEVRHHPDVTRLLVVARKPAAR